MPKPIVIRPDRIVLMKERNSHGATIAPQNSARAPRTSQFVTV